MRAFVVRLSIVTVLCALCALCAPGITRAQVAPGVVTRAADFQTGFVVSGDWLQANALPLNRSAMQSGDVTVSYRRELWAVDAGALRIARDLSNVSGGFVGGGVLFGWRRIVLHPALDVLVGRGEASVDSTGYDFVAPSGAVGHQPRYSYSSALTVGGGASLTVDVPVYRMVALHVAASQWFFSGQPLSLDRNRTLLGAGLSVRVHP